MKKSALSERSESKGFTLVELLVVVAILAILALIGYGVFSGLQGGVRDARRRIEIDQLSKNIESTRNAANGDYQYTDTKGQADYPDGLSDPSGGNKYCYAVATTSTPPANPTWTTFTSCPSGWLEIGGSTFTVTVNATAGTNDLQDSGVKGYKVCAGSERSTLICKGNIFR